MSKMAKKENTPQSITEPLHIKFRRQQRLADLAISRMTGKKITIQQYGAEESAKTKQQQKEWFYNNIWMPAYDTGITLLEMIIRYGIKNGFCKREENVIHFRDTKKSEHTLKKWHTEFIKRKKPLTS